MIQWSKYKKVALHVAYWLIAALFFYLFFWPTHQFPDFALVLIAIILPQSIAVTYIINYLLIPRFLFRKRYFLFFYILLAIIILSFWINILSLIMLLFWANLTIIPTNRDYAILLAGNYLIIFFAVIVHFILETLRQNRAKEAIEKQKMQTELKLHQANIELLKNQIHPHFLFNTLNNLYGLCLAQSDKAPDTVLKISELLDYILYKCNSEWVSLANEIEFLNNYIELEKMRADKRLTIVFDCCQWKEQTMIPPLLLFPFVENAFKHSARNNTANRTISIQLNIEQNNLFFIVKNNYVAAQTPKKTTGGLGLENVRKRLSYIYDENFSLKISDSNNLFIVKLRLPIENKKAAQ